MLQIFVNNEELDLYQDEDIKFTFQVNDIADVKDRQANYTNAFNIPKTPNNVRIFGGLGIHSDTSNSPYEKLECAVKVDGFDVIPAGWLNITETTDKEYRVNIYSGVIDFFKAIQGVNIGDLDLQEIEHEKNISTIISSQQNDNYRYLIADYNGHSHFQVNNENIVNTEPLIPSVSVSYLWNKIHSRNYGTDAKPIYFKDIIDYSFFKNLWFTYPKTSVSADTKNNANLVGDEIATIWDYFGSTMSTYGFLTFKENDTKLNSLFEWHKYPTREFRGHTFDNYGYLVAKKRGSYRIEFDITNVQTTTSLTFFIAKGISMSESPKNAYENYLYYSAYSEFTDWNKVAIKGETIINFNQGEFFCLGVKKSQRGSTIRYRDVNINIKITEVKTGEIEFADQLKQFSITDFIKEILVKFGLTMFVNPIKGEIEYLPISKLINGEVLNWSSKYINRTSEVYIHDDYAKENIFKYQYNDKEATFNNGSIRVENLNIKAQKDMFSSKTYSPDVNISNFEIGRGLHIQVPIIRFFDKQIKEQKEGNVIEYKLLDKRFHFVHSNDTSQTIYMGNSVVGNNVVSSIQGFSIADFSRLSWQNIINEYYTDLRQLITKSKLHKIELNLSLIDIIHLDFKKVYYFAQEQQYYLLNKLTFDRNKSVGEFIRINYITEIGTEIQPPTNPEPTPPETNIQISWYDEDNDLLTQDIADRSGLNTEVTVGASEYLSFEYKNYYMGDWAPLFTRQSASDEFLVVAPLEQLGITEIRGYKMVDGKRVYSNILKYNKTIDRNIKIYWVNGQQLRVGDVEDKNGTGSNIMVGSERPLYYEYKTPDSNEWVYIGGMRQNDSRDLRERAIIQAKIGLNEIRAYIFDENREKVYSNILRYIRTEDSTPITPPKNDNIQISWYDEDNDHLTGDTDEIIGTDNRVSVGSDLYLKWMYKKPNSSTWEEILRQPANVMSIPLEIGTTEIVGYKPTNLQQKELSNILRYTRTEEQESEFKRYRVAVTPIAGHWAFTFKNKNGREIYVNREHYTPDEYTRDGNLTFFFCAEKGSIKKEAGEIRIEEQGLC